MRQITDHHDGHGLADSIIVTSDKLDPEAGNAAHCYTVTDKHGRTIATVQFQHGPRAEDGSLSGCTDGVLLAIIVDRMRSFNAGPFGTRENALVMTHCQEALHWLAHRANERAARGVLGKNTA